jgi:hypothetical protein
MAKYDPLAFWLSTACATTPAPNMMRMKVPRNSAAASLSMADYGSRREGDRVGREPRAEEKCGGTRNTGDRTPETAL